MSLSTATRRIDKFQYDLDSLEQDTTSRRLSCKRKKLLLNLSMPWRKSPNVPLPEDAASGSTQSSRSYKQP